MCSLGSPQRRGGDGERIRARAGKGDQRKRGGLHGPFGVGLEVRMLIKAMILATTTGDNTGVSPLESACGTPFLRLWFKLSNVCTS